MNTKVIANETDLPGLYNSADQASLRAQSAYFSGLAIYLVLLTAAAFVSYKWPTDPQGTLASAVLFLITLGILIALKVMRPDDIWYNGRAVAESVKTRSWRWMMRAEPYQSMASNEIVSKEFINDLKSILSQNKSLSHELNAAKEVLEPISQKMRKIRDLPFPERLEIYKEQRINNQATWYAKKSFLNKRRGRQWFWASVALHSTAIGMLLYRIKDPTFTLPVEVVATAAGAVLTWLQAKKHGELNSSYALAAHEIMLIKGEALSVKDERDFSEFVIASESAFSREHTQWTARKTD
jgi:SMODS and SLOG-associating 2TM effector domain 3/SMODS and SLOG-associating 2TM effector domain 1